MLSNLFGKTAVDTTTANAKDDQIMGYSNVKPSRSVGTMLWKIGHSEKGALSVSILCFVFVALGLVSDLLNLKLGLGATSWLLLAIVAAMIQIGPHLHEMLARHLIGLTVIK